MEQSKIDRINELYRKSKAEGLTEAERRRTDTALRKEFVADVKKNLTAQLNNIDIQNEDGTIENLGEKYEITQRNFRKASCHTNAIFAGKWEEKSNAPLKASLQSGMV